MPYIFIPKKALHVILCRTKRICFSGLEILNLFYKVRDTHMSNNAWRCDRLIQMNYKHLELKSRCWWQFLSQCFLSRVSDPRVHLLTRRDHVSQDKEKPWSLVVFLLSDKLYGRKLFDKSHIQPTYLLIIKSFYKFCFCVTCFWAHKTCSVRLIGSKYRTSLAILVISFSV